MNPQRIEWFPCPTCRTVVTLSPKQDGKPLVMCSACGELLGNPNGAIYTRRERVLGFVVFLGFLAFCMLLFRTWLIWG